MRTGLDVIRRLCQPRRLYPKLLHERLRDGEHWTDLFSLRRLKIGHHFSFWFQVENFILLLIWFEAEANVIDSYLTRSRKIVVDFQVDSVENPFNHFFLLAFLVSFFLIFFFVSIRSIGLGESIWSIDLFVYVVSNVFATLQSFSMGFHFVGRHLRVNIDPVWQRISD